MKNYLYARVLDFYNQFLNDNICVKEALILGKGQPKLLDQFFLELDEAVKMFNRYLAGNLAFDIDQTMLINANTLKTILDGKMEIPSPFAAFEDLLSDEKLKTAFIEEFHKFDFLVEIGNNNKLLASMLVASYRTYMLVKYPFLKEKNVQVASALEEMFAIMVLTGGNKRLFHATKHWIMDWKAEGFSQELADKIAKL